MESPRRTFLGSLGAIFLVDSLGLMAAPKRKRGGGVLPANYHPFSVTVWPTTELQYLLPGMTHSIGKVIDDSGMLYNQDYVEWPAGFLDDGPVEAIRKVEGQYIFQVKLIDVVDQGGGNLDLSKAISQFAGSSVGQNAGRLNASKSTTKVVVDISLISPLTGRSELTIRGTGSAKGTSLQGYLTGYQATNANAGDSTIQFNQQEYAEAGFSSAFEEAVEQALLKTKNKMAELPWEVEIADVEKDQIYLGIGSKSGLKVGQQLIALAVKKYIYHPKSGFVLDVITEELGKLTVTQVLSATTVCTADPGIGLQVGDIVRV